MTNQHGGGFPPGWNPQQPQYSQPQQQPQQQQPPYGVPQHPPAPGPQAPQQAGAPIYQYVEPAQEVIDSSLQRAQALRDQRAQAQSGGFGDGATFFDLFGPSGVDYSWKQAPAGFRSMRGFFFAPPWPGAVEEGYLNHVERISHYYEVAGRGQSVNCGKPWRPGGAQDGDRCLVCEAYDEALNQGVKNPWCRRSRKIVYQGFPLEWINQQFHPNPAACTHQDGVLRPMLYEAPVRVYDELQKLIPIRGFGGLFNPAMGRPFLIEKIKAGPQRQQIEYNVIEMDPMPLPPEYHQGLMYLAKLSEVRFLLPATLEEQRKAVMEAGLPMPNDGSGWSAQPSMYQQPAQPQMLAASYQGAASPPHPSPYGQQPPMPLPMPQSPQQPPMPLPAPQSPQQSLQYPVTAGAPYPQGSVPVQRTPVQAPPQPQYNPPPPPSMVPQKQQVAPGTLLAGDQTQTGLALPGGREMCFTRYSASDRICQECPDWIKNQCVAQSVVQAQGVPASPPAVSGAPAPAPTPEEIQQQIMGASGGDQEGQ